MNIVLFILAIPFMALLGTHVWFSSFKVSELLKVPFIIIILVLANLEFLLVQYFLLNNGMSLNSILFCLASISICTLIPPIIFCEKVKLKEGFNGEYFCMARVTYLNIIIFVAPVIEKGM